MIGFLLASSKGIDWRNGDIWYALPLIIAVSLVYAATRHERMQPILVHAGHVALWIVVVMAAMFAALAAISWYA